MKGVFSLRIIKNYLNDWSNFFSFALALIPSVLLYIFAPNAKIPYIVFLITLFLLILSAWLNFKLLLNINERQSVSIELVRCIDNRIVCLPNNLLTHHSIVSFYTYQNDFEEFVASGFVETINTKGLAQIILFDDTASSFDNPFNYISNHKNSIIIKPTLTTDTMQNFSKII